MQQCNPVNIIRSIIVPVLCCRCGRSYWSRHCHRSLDRIALLLGTFVRSYRRSDSLWLLVNYQYYISLLHGRIDEAGRTARGTIADCRNDQHLQEMHCTEAAANASLFGVPALHTENGSSLS